MRKKQHRRLKRWCQKKVGFWSVSEENISRKISQCQNLLVVWQDNNWKLSSGFSNTEVIGDLSKSIDGSESSLGWLREKWERKNWNIDDFSKEERRERWKRGQEMRFLIFLSLIFETISNLNECFKYNTKNFFLLNYSKVSHQLDAPPS